MSLKHILRLTLIKRVKKVFALFPNFNTGATFESAEHESPINFKNFLQTAPVR